MLNLFSFACDGPRLYGERIVAPITAAAFVLLVGIVFPFSSATAEPIDLNGSIPLGAGSISGTLRGNLVKNILTLNSSLPGSKISVNTAASGPLPPSILPESFTYTQNYSVDSPFGDSMSYNVEFIRLGVRAVCGSCSSRSYLTLVAP